MSELPGTIQIKRKLVEDPPDTLYIEHEGHDFDAGYSHARPIYRLVQAAKRPRMSQDYSKPSMQRSNHGEVVQAQTSQDGSIKARKIPVITTTDTTSKADSKATDYPKTKSANATQSKRVFHLSAARMKSLSRVSSYSSLRGSSQQRRKRPSVAVFSEKTALKVDQMAELIINSRSQTPSGENSPNRKDVKPRKKPLTRSLLAEDNHKLSMADADMPDQNQDNEADLRLAMELQQFAMETIPPTEISASEGPASSRIDTARSFQSKPMKYQPRPRSERNIRKIGQPIGISTSIPRVTSTEILLSQEESTEWVYDVYVRDVAPSSKQAPDNVADVMESMTSGPDGNIGYIVIRAEDEQAWEEFMSDDEDSEVDWDDGDQDSNAEDHYANDYPDELDSDDEWALGNASDEEFNDSDHYNHSDSEDK